MNLETILDDPAGRLGAILGGIGVVFSVTVYIVKKLREVANDLGLVKHEVKNNHTTNLREEADVRHDENSGKLDTVLSMVDTVQRNQGRLYDLLAATILRVDGLETRTQNEHPNPKQEKSE